MKNSSTLFLKCITLLIAAGALFAMIRFPQTEGRAEGLDLLSIYADPFIIYAYLASIPFFIGLFYTYKVLGYSEKGRIASRNPLESVKYIKYCALLMVGLIVAPLMYLVIALRGKDDIAGGVAGGLFLILVFTVVATTASYFQKSLQKAVNVKA